MLPLVVLIAATLWSSLVLGMVLWQVLTSRVQLEEQRATTPQAIGTRKGLSEGLTDDN